jgi:hypothetical protein
MGNKISIADLIDKNTYTIVGESSNFTKTSFWYYTRLKNADLILKNNCFYCRNLEEMNDKSEAELHGDNSKFIHALCFCNSISEKIPMWYLYSGISGNGVSLGLTSAIMLKFISSIKTVRTPDNIELQKGTDFEMDFGWVYYRKQDNTRDIKYRGKRYSLIDIDPSDFETNNYFIKDYPWEYENEFRIIIKNKTEIPYEKLIIEIPDDIIDSLKIRLAPELSENSFVNCLPDLKGFHKYISKKCEHSKLSICMGLCKRNADDIIDNMSEIITEKNANKICNQIKLTDFCENNKV